MDREYPLQTRIDEGLYGQLKAAADANLRSVSAEAYLRLKTSFAGEPRGGIAPDGAGASGRPAALQDKEHDNKKQNCKQG